jgi:hypothetical protein
MEVNVKRKKNVENIKEAFAHFSNVVVSDFDPLGDEDKLIDSYKDLNFIPYSVWSYFRGITAPTFFTISGLIFNYLLLKAKEKGTEKLRMRKGIIRGFSLIGIGYLLRIPFLAWFSGSFNTYFLVIDVLQCIGLSLLVIILLYFLCAKRIFLFSVVVFVLGIVIFLSEPLYRTLSIDALPMFFNNYISKSILQN